MYIYTEDLWFGADRVVWVDDFAGEDGDVVKIQDGYGICLGGEVAFPELRTANLPRGFEIGDIVEKKLLKKKTLAHIHRCVMYRFTTYKHVLPLFLGSSIQQLLLRKLGKPKKRHDTPELRMTQGVVSLAEEVLSSEQKLMVFPHVWAISQYVSNELLSLPYAIVLHGQMTEKQRSQAFWKCKQGKVAYIFATYSQIFHDWSHLGQICCIDEHTRWYKNQKEPRYHAVTVLQEMASHYKATLITTGLSLE